MAKQKRSVGRLVLHATTIGTLYVYAVLPIRDHLYGFSRETQNRLRGSIDICAFVVRRCFAPLIESFVFASRVVKTEMGRK